MKKLLTILLLFAMTAMVSACFYTKTQEISFMQEADEEGKKVGEEKNEKEDALHSVSKKPELSTQRIFRSYFCSPGLSPVVDHLTPPPDFT